MRAAPSHAASEHGGGGLAVGLGALSVFQHE